MPTDAREICTDAFGLIGVATEGAEVSAYDIDVAFRSLVQMGRRWQTQGLTFPFVTREVFDITANQGTYTIGPNGDFDTTRPPSNSITGTALLLNSSSPAVEVPIGLLTDDAYEAIQVKSLTNAQWTNLYYRPTYDTDLGTIILWPIPTTADNDLVLYRTVPVAEFADLSTDVYVPPGYEDALTYQLAIRLAVPYARPVSQELQQQATDYLADIKRSNYRLTDLRVDPALVNDKQFLYNIQTGNG